MLLVPQLLRLPSLRRLRRSRMLTLLLAFTVLAIFVTPFYVVYRPPNALISYFQRRWPDVLFQVQTQQKVVALTIDDAPSQHTADILAALDSNGASATFFVIGSQVEGAAQEQMLEQLVRHGNELGNHAMHDEASHVLNDAQLAEQLAAVQAKLDAAYAAAGVAQPEQRYFRPGSGFFSARMRKLLARLDYRLVLGGIYPHDAQISLWRANAAHILSLVRPGGIIVCHDRRGWTAPMLGKVLPELRRRGYRVVTVSQLLELHD